MRGSFAGAACIAALAVGCGGSGSAGDQRAAIPACGEARLTARGALYTSMGTVPLSGATTTAIVDLAAADAGGACLAHASPPHRFDSAGTATVLLDGTVLFACGGLTYDAADVYVGRW
jgi:uncharacterized Zn-binding protein involved in type VI secretion